MPPIPRVCSGCRRPFDPTDPRRRLVVLENSHALCGECEWRAAHPESLPRRLAPTAFTIAVAANR